LPLSQPQPFGLISLCGSTRVPPSVAANSQRRVTFGEPRVRVVEEAVRPLVFRDLDV